MKALRKVHPEITTVVLNVNNKQTSMVLGERKSRSTDRDLLKTDYAAVRSVFLQNRSIR